MSEDRLLPNYYYKIYEYQKKSNIKDILELSDDFNPISSKVKDTFKIIRKDYLIQNNILPDYPFIFMLNFKNKGYVPEILMPFIVEDSGNKVKFLPIKSDLFDYTNNYEQKDESFDCHEKQKSQLKKMMDTFTIKKNLNEFNYLKNTNTDEYIKTNHTELNKLISNFFMNCLKSDDIDTDKIDKGMEMIDIILNKNTFSSYSESELFQHKKEKIKELEDLMKEIGCIDGVTKSPKSDIGKPIGIGINKLQQIGIGINKLQQIGIGISSDTAKPIGIGIKIQRKHIDIFKYIKDKVKNEIFGETTYPLKIKINPPGGGNKEITTSFRTDLLDI